MSGDLLAGAAARALARRSSRRQLFKFLGAGSLGAGLFLTDVSLGAITSCVGCGGGPCNPCASPFQQCSHPDFPCKTCAQGGGCPAGCTTSGEWFCCTTATQCRRRCSECSCPAPGSCCRCFTDLGMPCQPRRWSGDQPCQCSPPPPGESAIAA